MPTPFSHPAAALALAPWFRPIARPAVVVVALFLSVLPDIDILGFRIGVPYGSLFGHRGFTHSILFAAVCALAAALALERSGRGNPLVLWTYFFIAAGSHGVLDACTNGGLGVAFFAPFDSTRYRFSWHPVKVSPLTVAQLFTARGWTVFQSELVWIWCPALALAATGMIWHRRRR
jgi:inner membrane protein